MLILWMEPLKMWAYLRTKNNATTTWLCLFTAEQHHPIIRRVSSTSSASGLSSCFSRRSHLLRNQRIKALQRATSRLIHCVWWSCRFHSTHLIGSYCVLQPVRHVRVINPLVVLAFTWAPDHRGPDWNPLMDCTTRSPLETQVKTSMPGVMKTSDASKCFRLTRLSKWS